MLTKPSKATNLLDLQLEISQNKSTHNDIEMRDEDQHGSTKHSQKDLIAALTDEITKAFDGMFK
jgi:hypothetical protein